MTSNNVTGGQADGQTDDMRSQKRALHYRASRGKNGPVGNSGLESYHSTTNFRQQRTL